jgi:hypothetical protein
VHQLGIYRLYPAYVLRTVCFAESSEFITLLRKGIFNILQHAVLFFDRDRAKGKERRRRKRRVRRRPRGRGRGK